MRTGIFYYYQKGERLKDFPQALKGILEKENVFLYDAFYPSKPPSSFELDPIPPEILYQIHAPEMVERVRKTGNFEGALFSATGTVRSAEKIWQGEIDNAFVFTGYGDHHAGNHFFGGGCYFNGAAVAIQELRSRFGAKRFAILDTDAHHGDGTWEIFGTDRDVLYICFCGNPDWEENNKVDIHVPNRVTDGIYSQMIRGTVFPRLRVFQPEVLFWNWGYDGTKGEYGDIGLSPGFHVLLAKELKGIADEICQGKFIIVLCGGSRRDLARYLIPKVIEILSG
jgi:acetoin utilization deacetylase AcuC-like enzyme